MCVLVVLVCLKHSRFSQYRIAVWRERHSEEGRAGGGWGLKTNKTHTHARARTRARAHTHTHTHTHRAQHRKLVAEIQIVKVKPCLEQKGLIIVH